MDTIKEEQLKVIRDFLFVEGVAISKAEGLLEAIENVPVTHLLKDMEKSAETNEHEERYQQD